MGNAIVQFCYPYEHERERRRRARENGTGFGSEDLSLSPAQQVKHALRKMDQIYDYRRTVIREKEATAVRYYRAGDSERAVAELRVCQTQRMAARRLLALHTTLSNLDIQLQSARDTSDALLLMKGHSDEMHSILHTIQEDIDVGRLMDTVQEQMEDVEDVMAHFASDPEEENEFIRELKRMAEGRTTTELESRKNLRLPDRSQRRLPRPIGGSLALDSATTFAKNIQVFEGKSVSSGSDPRSSSSRESRIPLLADG